MKKFFSIGGITLALCFPTGFTTDPDMRIFETSTSTPDVTVEYSGWASSMLAEGDPVGKDSHFNYYTVNGLIQAQKRHGSLGFCSVVRFSADFAKVTVHLLYTDSLTAKMLLQHLPLKIIFAAFGTTLLHASQISYSQRSILFTAPSGTGKTTQARLWCRYGAAIHLSGDRTTIRRIDKSIYSFGYPFDGTEPVLTNTAAKLGAIVVLGKSDTDSIARLSGVSAFRELLSQSSVPYWHPALLESAAETLSIILDFVPVYRLLCTPRESAVECLKERLISDGVIA